jgi:hypothetical protein
MSKDIDVLIDPPELFAGLAAWQQWREGLNKDDPEIPAIAQAIQEADEVLRWYAQHEAGSIEAKLQNSDRQAA